MKFLLFSLLSFQVFAQAPADLDLALNEAVRMYNSEQAQGNPLSATGITPIFFENIPVIDGIDVIESPAIQPVFVFLYRGSTFLASYYLQDDGNNGYTGTTGCDCCHLQAQQESEGHSVAVNCQECTPVKKAPYNEVSLMKKLFLDPKFPVPLMTLLKYKHKHD